MGSEITLCSNYFPVGIPEGPLYEYAVEISPAARNLSHHFKWRIYQLAEQTTAWKQVGLVSNVAHDNSSKVVFGRILLHPITITVPYYDEDQQGPPAAGSRKISEMKILLPPEVCEILQNQPFFGELTKDHTANMITVA